MNCKALKIIIFLLIVIMFGIGSFFIIRGLTMEDDKKDDKRSFSSVDTLKIIDDLKNNNDELVYESQNIVEFKSLAFNVNNEIKSYYINNETGQFMNIEDLFKENKFQAFLEKEVELLNKKYPRFIVEGIEKTDGYKEYLVKDNELIIYYYDYTYEYDYSNQVFLIINYNEINEYLNFTHLLDDSYENEDGYNYVADKKTVAITFDDGPGSYNSQFLEVLADNKAHATFFMVGSMMNSCQKCVLNTYNSGNEIGSHTYEHINIKKNSDDLVATSLKKTDDLFYKITNDHIKYVRPPYGSYDSENLKNIDNPLILWNMDPEDWRYRDVDKIVDYIMENVKDGSIILMHETYKTSLEALKIILPQLYALDYQVVSISELATLKNKNLEAGHAYRSLYN